MSIEYESKVLDIDPEDIRSKLRDLNAQEFPEYRMKRMVFAMGGMPYRRYRVRDNGGDNITLTYKERKSTDIDGVYELEIKVSDFNTTVEMLKKTGIVFKGIYYQENKRQIFKLDDIEFMIDTWPMLNPLVEVESTSKQKVEHGLELLGLTGQDIGNVSLAEVFEMKGMDLHKFKDLRLEE